jgi:hypothetical protein
MPTIIFVSHIMARTSYISMGCWWWCLLCTRQISLVGSWIALNHWNNIPQVDVWLLFVTLQWVRLNQSLLCKYQFYCRWCVPIGLELSISIVDVSFISGGNRSTQRNPPTYRKSQKNFITMLYRVHHAMSGIRTHNFSSKRCVALNTINLSLFHLFTYSPMFCLIICSRGDYCWNTV